MGAIHENNQYQIITLLSQSYLRIKLKRAKGFGF